MKIQQRIQDIVKKVSAGESINREEIEYLLRIPTHTIEAGLVISAADKINREASNNTAEVHAQIGLNLSPCPNNCSFCAFAAKNKVFKEPKELALEDILQMAQRAEEQGANALFVMATGDYPLDKFIEVSLEINAHTKPGTIMIANVGDFNYDEAKKLKAAGYAGIYHAIRMGEGKDTQLDPDMRMNTIKSAREAGLLIGTCVEPIGPEHTIEEITEKIMIGRQMKPCYSGAMRRINIPGSSLEQYGMLSEYQLAYWVAVVRLAMGRNLKANCTHEPNILGASMGANLFWAEVGTNPRDTKEETSESRGMDVYYCQHLFKEAEYQLLPGPSIFYRQDNTL
jgi:biotin synthase